MDSRPLVASEMVGFSSRTNDVIKFKCFETYYNNFVRLNVSHLSNDMIRDRSGESAQVIRIDVMGVKES